MIKLQDLVNEIYAQEPDNPNTDIIQKGYRLRSSEVDPETGKVTSDVEYLPQFEEIRRQLLIYRKEIQPFKYSSNADIAKLSKEVNTAMTKLSQMIFALDKMMELERRR